MNLFLRCVLIFKKLGTTSLRGCPVAVRVALDHFQPYDSFILFLGAGRITIYIPDDTS